MKQNNDTQKIKTLIARGETNKEIMRMVPKATMQQIYNQRYRVKKNAGEVIENYRKKHPKIVEVWDKLGSFTTTPQEKESADYHDAMHKAVVDGMKPPIRMQSQPQSILDEAREIIYGDREKTYGSPDKNLCAIAGYWSNHLLTRFGVHHEITGADVCIMMTLLKAARLGNDLTHRDSLVDAAGYLALLERIQK
jgi:hypothetical protein